MPPSDRAIQSSVSYVKWNLSLACPDAVVAVVFSVAKKSSVSE
jgi:hypothetical protein